ncbi:histone acetyltransferase HAC1-like isoform X2 [Iris pallida]|uniref:histone acetyltransferase n=1 Tax=Iris pallida TaxID=29817 RepID=A0AAX6GDD2_IRIPA|nr:histone acetyltransferase HAC1-like isoform X2 [Iris pallida]
MQSIEVYNMDHDLVMSRRKMQENIEIFLRKSNLHTDWSNRIPELSRRLEERIFKDTASKEDYMNIPMAKIEQQLQATLRNALNNNQQSSHHVSSSSAVSTMMPTPGMVHSGSTSSMTSVDNSMITTGDASVALQTANAGNLLPTSNGSFNASAGTISNGYQNQKSLVNVAHSAGGNNMMPSIGISRHSSHMIPTPGLNNSQPMTINSEYSNGGGFSSMDSSLVPQQSQQKVYVGNQNTRMLHGLGGQMLGVRSNMQHRPSGYGLPSGGSGLVGSNMHEVNGLETPDSYAGAASYGGSSRPIQQHYDRQHHRAIPGHGYAMNATDLSASRSLYGSASSVVSSVNNQNMNSMGLYHKPKANQVLNHASFQSMQESPHFKSQMLDHSQNMNFQAAQTMREHLVQQQVQNLQQQQFQQPNQPYERPVQHQHHPQNQQNQHLVPKTNTMRLPSVASGFGGHSLPEHGIESYNELLIPQATQQYQLSEFQSQYQQSATTSNLSKAAHLLGQSSVSQDSQPSFSQSSQQMLHTQNQVNESQNDFGCLSSMSEPDALQQGHWRPQQKPPMADKLLYEEQFQEEFHQRINMQDEVQQSQFSSEASMPDHVSIMQGVKAQTSNGVGCGPKSCTMKKNYKNQMRWLLFLLHARKCSAPEGSCQEVNCVTVQQLWLHMELCDAKQCGYPRCCQSKKLIYHYSHCRVEACPVCIPTRKFVATAIEAQKRFLLNVGIQMNESSETVNTMSTNKLMGKIDIPVIENSDATHLSPKRLKSQHCLPSVVPKKEPSPVSVSHMNLTHASKEMQHQSYQQADLTPPLKKEANEVKTESSMVSVQGNFTVFGNINDDGLKIVHAAKPDSETLVLNEVVGHAGQESMLVEKERDQTMNDVKQEGNTIPPDPVAGGKSGKPKIKGVSLTELFTPEQIRDHIVSLRQWVGQSKAKAEKNQAMERLMSENSCQLCAVERLTFEPPPIYCTPCGARIKRNAMYYTMGSGDTRHYFCIPCYNEARGDTISIDGSAFPKARLDKKKNDEETEEAWVECEKCKAWQHQICALFNGRRNDGGQAEYICPNCYVGEIEKGERKPLPQSAVLGAKDLPGTILSDHIEQRLARRLKQERQERARQLGKSFDEVPGAESLVVRVVSSVDKKLEVKQRFLEVFQEENYPTEFPYKSKVILLFQKIEGVEVCLFGMYVQEFGSECQFPNQRRVYLSYLDSVKYFRPEIKTVTGEALRTFVYHEILIGYLEYCKKRGFTSCYIWACPPLKGEDYILYCHPEIQKTPKSDKLREWYLAMLRKAVKESIVAELTNLYDHFFITMGECKAKVTAARLPYFDGDYWPGAAEDMITQLREEEDGRKQQKKGKTKKIITKRALKAAGQTDLSGNASKDALLMQKLGETIYPMKEDFIMVHLQHSCTHCCLLMVSGTCWVCNQCKSFKLCEKCYDAEQKLDERERHPINSREMHDLFRVEINGVPSDTKDKDEILESEFFDTRQAFLSLCQGNHYQYDTLRRAKHSSMMVLYHLHNPTAPAFVTTCNVCQNDIEAGQGWRCEICPDFDVCNGCYQKNVVDHPHKLTNHPSMADRDAQNQEARQKRVLQLRKMLDLLVHASQCRFPHCQYPNCRKVKGLFRHGIQCKTRASGGCLLCKKMWYLLQLHARACKESECHVPRCKDLKEHLKRLQQQSDSRRRAAVMEMMRQRAAEVAGNND